MEERRRSTGQSRNGRAPERRPSYSGQGPSGGQRRRPADDYYQDSYRGERGRAYISPEEERRRRQEKARRRKRRERERRMKKIRRMTVLVLLVIALVVVILTGRRNGARTLSEAAGRDQEETAAQAVTAETAAGTTGETADPAPEASGEAESAVQQEAPAPEVQTEVAMTDAELQALAEEERAKKNLSPEVASFYPFYSFRETAETTVIPVAEETPEVETTEETASEETQEEEHVGNAYCASDYVILVDCDSGAIVVDKQAKKRICPASMTKVLTLLVAVEHMEDPERQLTEPFTITQEIAEYGYAHDSSSVCWTQGEVVTVQDLLYGTILPSGADAALALAQYTAGTESAFVALMNEKLSSLGLADSAHFTNCVGLYSEDHYCSCYDMAVIMKAAVENDLCRKILSEHTYTTSKTDAHPDGIEISNWFLRRIEDKDSHGNVLCGKTGFVNESGYCAVSYQESAGGGHYILCTVHTWSSWRCIYDHVYIYSNYTR